MMEYNTSIILVNDHVFFVSLSFYLSHSASGMDALKIEEMEKMLKEAHLEKARLIESRVRNQPVESHDTATFRSQETI